MAFEVGSDVEALCKVCGDVWHVVVAKVGEKITKVQCKQCNKQHRFKPTGDAPTANLETKRRKVASKRVPMPGLAKGVFDPSKPSRPYSMRERFGLGEQIRHKKFGDGVVGAVEDEKIHVSFGGGVTKVLRHAREG